MVIVNQEFDFRFNTEITIPTVIHCVDDNRTQLMVYRKFLSGKGYHVEYSDDPRQALKKITSSKRKPDLLLLDIEMPYMNGLELMRKIKEKNDLKNSVIIMVSSVDNSETVVDALKSGASDYIRKPFLKEELLARIEVQINAIQIKKICFKKMTSLQNEVTRKIGEIVELHDTTIFSMAKLAESRDPETGSHLERIREYTRVLAEQLSLLPNYKDIIDDDYLYDIYHMSAIHDIGKVGIPDSILLKPGTLTNEEFEIMKQHTVIGGDALKAICNRNPIASFLNMGRDIAYSHHEKWNGKGYPFGISGEDIPLAARITAIADHYDAMHSRRVYRKEPMADRRIEEILESEAGKTLDPTIYQVYIKIREQFSTINKQYID